MEQENVKLNVKLGWEISFILQAVQNALCSFGRGLLRRKGLFAVREAFISQVNGLLVSINDTPQACTSDKHIDVYTESELCINGHDMFSR